MFLLFSIARIVLKQKPFSRVVQEICGKILQSCSKVYKPYHKVDWLSSYFHACHDEITYFNRCVFQYGYHDMVRVLDAGQIFVICFDKLM